MLDVVAGVLLELDDDVGVVCDEDVDGVLDALLVCELLVSGSARTRVIVLLAD